MGLTFGRQHIVSRKHRRFADDDGNWKQLDALLGQLTRRERYRLDDDDDDDEEVGAL